MKRCCFVIARTQLRHDIGQCLRVCRSTGIKKSKYEGAACMEWSSGGMPQYLNKEEKTVRQHV